MTARTSAMTAMTAALVVVASLTACTSAPPAPPGRAVGGTGTAAIVWPASMAASGTIPPAPAKGAAAKPWDWTVRASGTWAGVPIVVNVRALPAGTVKAASVNETLATITRQGLAAFADQGVSSVKVAGATDAQARRFSFRSKASPSSPVTDGLMLAAVNASGAGISLQVTPTGGATKLPDVLASAIEASITLP